MSSSSHPHRRHLIVVLALPLMLSCRAQPAAEALLTPTQAHTQTPCPADPPTGMKAKIVAEDEIGFVYRYEDDGYLRHKTVDLTDPTTLAEVAFKKYSSMDALTSVGWISTAAADVNGDGKKEIVSAVQDKNKRLAVITNGPKSYEWYYDSSAWKVYPVSRSYGPGPSRPARAARSSR